VARELKGLDSRHLGGHADGFREKFPSSPARWHQGADAFEEAATALEDFAGTVSCAQGQAKEALTKYNKGKSASDAHCGKPTSTTRPSTTVPRVTTSRPSQPTSVLCWRLTGCQFSHAATEERGEGAHSDEQSHGRELDEEGDDEDASGTEAVCELACGDRPGQSDQAGEGQAETDL
jgi:hypothetical protein